MDLILVESPAKARTLSKFLGGNYRIEPTMGHIRDLPKSKIGVDVEHDFGPDYVISEDKKKIVERLRKIAGESEKIILATDPDREGEAIAYHVREVIREDIGNRGDKGDKGKEEEKFTRIAFHEITDQAVKNALEHPGEINMTLVEAQQARRVLDRLVGYKLSPLLWRKVRKGLSAGRVQSVAVRLIVEREKEIENFKAEEFWVMEAELTKIKNEKLKSKNYNAKFKSDEGFFAKLVKINDKKAEVKDQAEADGIIKELEKAEYKVADVKQLEVKKYPYPPFTTSTMAQSAANLFGWSAKKTMMIAQQLYEEGLITYHRTDSLNLALGAVGAVREFIKNNYGAEHLPEKPVFYKTKSKSAQEAHEAIRPTAVGQISNFKFQISNETGKDYGKLYNLIWKRFVACQMRPAVYDRTAVDITADKYVLRALGSRMKSEGWKKLYEIKNEKLKSKNYNAKFKSEKTEGEMNEEDRRLPELTEGEILQFLRLLPQQKFTQPPARYNEASLIKKLEEEGIGRPSTYVPIISTILFRNYAEKEEGKFKPTVLGRAVNGFLVSNFQDIVDYKFTAGMEDKLDEIAAGRINWAATVKDFYAPFASRLDKVAESAPRVEIPAEMTEEKCEKCGKLMLVRLGRFGRFLACSGFPGCKNTKAFTKKAGMKCPKCSDGEVIIKKTGKGRPFYGCSRYPDCDFASWKKPGENRGDKGNEGKNEVQN